MRSNERLAAKREMSAEPIFYVYIFFRLNGIPCYVGKGQGGRWVKHVRASHNRRLRRIFAQASRQGLTLPVFKVRENLSEAEAFRIESDLIREIGRADLGCGPLVNLTDGGDGPAGLRHSKKTGVILGQKSRAMWADPIKREQIETAASAGKQTPEYRARRSEIANEIWSRPNAKARKESYSAAAAIQYADLVTRAEHGLAVSKGYTSPEAKTNASAAQRLRFSRATEIEKISDAHVKFTEQQIASILDEQRGGGESLAQMCKRYGITASTFYRWRMNRRLGQKLGSKTRILK